MNHRSMHTAAAKDEIIAKRRPVRSEVKNRVNYRFTPELPITQILRAIFQQRDTLVPALS